MIRLIEEMTPRELLEVINKNGIAFVPVSPKYEWHSFHLPLGTDGIIAEEVSKNLADIMAEQDRWNFFMKLRKNGIVKNSVLMFFLFLNKIVMNHRKNFDYIPKLAVMPDF